MQIDFQLSEGSQTRLNKAKPPADALDFLKEFIEQAKVKSDANTPRRI